MEDLSPKVRVVGRREPPSPVEIVIRRGSVRAPPVLERR